MIRGALFDAWRGGLLGRDRLVRNVAGGLVVGVVAMPLAMAFAIASGAKPEQGLYTAVVAGLIVAVFGGSRVQIAGPTGAFAVVLVGITAEHGFAGLQIVTALAGLMLVLFGLARLGGVIRYIPESVVLGFTAGIAVVIWVGQWQNFFGLPAIGGESLLERLPGLLAALPHLHATTTALGVGSVLLIALWTKLPFVGRVPSPLVALIAGTAFVAVAQPEGVATIGSVFGGIPRGLPPLTLPHASLSTVLELARPAFAIALLGAIESLLSATVADGMIGAKHDSNQELVGQGLANVGAALFGGFAATGAIARTATNVRHGGDSPLAGIVHSVTVLAVLVALAPLAYDVPLATLAAILFVVSFNMSQIGRVVRTARRAPRSDVAVMLVTLALTVFADLSLAVEVGVILALLNFFRRMTSAVAVRPLVASEASGEEPSPGTPLGTLQEPLPEGVLLFSIDGPFFFGAVEEFESALARSGTDPSAIVISMAEVPFIDLSALVALREAVESFHSRGVTVAVCCANSGVAESIRRATAGDILAADPALSLAAAIEAVSGAPDEPAGRAEAS